LDNNNIFSTTPSYLFIEEVELDNEIDYKPSIPENEVKNIDNNLRNSYKKSEQNINNTSLSQLGLGEKDYKYETILAILIITLSIGLIVYN
jgi:hypothetical protein